MSYKGVNVWDLFIHTPLIGSFTLCDRPPWKKEAMKQMTWPRAPESRKGDGGFCLGVTHQRWEFVCDY
jgi:hypothetical protein